MVICYKERKKYNEIQFTKNMAIHVENVKITSFSLVFKFTSASVFLPYRAGFSCALVVALSEKGRIIQYDYRK